MITSSEFVPDNVKWYERDRWSYDLYWQAQLG